MIEKITIFEHQAKAKDAGIRKRAIMLNDDCVEIVDEFFCKGNRWELLGSKFLTLEEFEACKALFER